MHQTSTAPAADRREHPRVEVPLEVELEHPCTGRRRCRVRDISQDGLFIEFPDHQLNSGARVRITPVAPGIIAHDHRPTVELEVTRSAEDGVGTRFANRTQAYLFSSFRQRRTHLEVGVDYFQVYVAALVLDDQGRLLTVDENGRWLFPGTWLQVGERIDDRLGQMLTTEVDLTLENVAPPLATTALDNGLAPEGATLALFHPCRVAGEARIGEDSRYRRLRWLPPGRDPSDLAFADPWLRRLACSILLQQ